MRIVSGIYKGRRFEAPRTISVRPTTDIAKEALFNILNSQRDIDGAVVLDLFAGIGNISLEFLSRGATSVTAVDMNNECLSFIRSIADKWGMEGLVLQRQDAFAYPKSTNKKFDIIFADPPYQASDVARLPDMIFKNEILNNGGIFILEHSKQYDFSVIPQFREMRRYGKVHFSFFVYQSL
ncbi:MAG: 16S rRNA (guanine(966)-N(2))-methyltransferase RsmD [Bacteroidales bacterium]|jgi:16S rRNA (guanine(966)-N(2))-methyltransferase RsmD|nr:16S rRNA (guanine(966)-N(2))-methyltransferase RsmD [Bacteroidales bacterium]